MQDASQHVPTVQVQVEEKPPVAPRKKARYIGAPACFALEMACKTLRDAFGSEVDESSHIGIYAVGSCLERPDWRDVDVVMIMDDASFQRLFPDVTFGPGFGANWEFDPRWTLMVTLISRWLKEQTGLPVDFKFQPMSYANERHNKQRHAVGLRFAKRSAITC